MKLTVIGHWGGYPARDGATSSYLIEKDDFTLVIDLGSGSLSKIQKYKSIDEISAVVLSHYHHDHVADLGVLQYAKLIQYYVTGKENILPIYGTAEDKQGFESLTHNFTEGLAYDPSNTLEIGPFQIDFLKTVHPVACFGMRITDGENVIVYTADTAYQEEWIPFSHHADLLITDCNYFAGQDGLKAGHMTSTEGASLAQKAQVNELILSHLPQFGDHQDLLKEAASVYDGKIQLAEEGLTWEK